MPPLPEGRVPAASAQRAHRFALAGVAVGLVLTAVAWRVDAHRFAFSYLVGFLAVVSIALGALALLLLQHLTRAGWSAAARRQLEWIADPLTVALVLFIPIAVLGPELYEWMRPEALKDALIAKKVAFLNRPAFIVRGVVCLGIWGLLALVFARKSRLQDESARPAVQSAWMQKWSAPGVIAVGLTGTLASFDWIMSLDPKWYSTIFGIYFIAGSLVGALALLSLLTLSLERRGLYGPVSTVEHRHDIGKLLFGFTCFWAYIAFCQFFLIWYAGLPEETIFFNRRWVGSWQAVSWALMIGHFALPFVVLIGRTAKRSKIVLGAAALLLVTMHVLDLYWLVMPTLDPGGARPGLIDVAGLWMPVSVLVLCIARRAQKDPVYPLRDPRLAEAVALVNP